jgi:hypothetical protein
MSALDDTDPTGWSDARLEEHSRRWCELPVTQVGPIATPVGHPDHYPDLADYLACEGINTEDER